MIELALTILAAFGIAGVALLVIIVGSWFIDVMWPELGNKQ